MRIFDRSKSNWLLAWILTVVISLLHIGCGGASGSTGSGSGGGGGGTPPPPPPSTTHILNLQANQLLYDSSRQQLYASIGSADSSHPDTVAVIDPSNATVTSTIPVGTDPHRLALSQDGLYLYVGADGIHSVQRVNLVSKTIESTIDLGKAALDGVPLVAGDIQVMPGAPRTIAVARKDPQSSPSAQDVVVYDDITMRPNTSSTASRATIDVIAFSDSGGVLYGLNNEISDFSFVRMSVDPTGVSVQDATTALLGWGYFATMAYNSGLIYSSFGSIVNPSTLVQLGTLPANPASLPNQSTAPHVEGFIVDGGVPYLLTHDPSKGLFITAYDAQHFVITASSAVQKSGTQEEYNLAKCGNTGFAFIGANVVPGGVTKSVVITTAPLTPVTPTTPTLSNLMPNHLLWDSGTGRLYASVPAVAGSWGNSVAVIDPATQAIEDTIYVGSEPHALAVSSDSQYLYAGLDGAGAIARVNLATHSLEAQYSLGNEIRTGPRRAQEIAVIPGSPHSYVAILRYKSNPSPNDAGTFVYDDGVPRAKSLGANDVIAFSDSPSTFYGLNTQVDGNMHRLTLDSSGISLSATIPSPMAGIATRLQYYSGKLYGSDGRAVTSSIPELAGTFKVSSPRDIAVDGPGGAAYFLADNTTTQKASLLQYDLIKFVLMAYQDLPVAAGSGSEVVQCGANGFAILASPGILFMKNQFTAVPGLGTNAANLAVNRMLWNPGSGQIIASVPGYVGPGGNSVALIDPVSKTITSSFFVGSEPDPMALSSDGTTLFVGLDGSGMVAQVDLKAESVTYTTSMGFEFSVPGFPRFANYLAAKPGDPNVVAVSRNAGVIVLDHGSQLSNTVDSPFYEIESLAFGSAGTDLYGYDNLSTGFDFYRMNVNSSGVSLIDHPGLFLSGFYAEIQNHNGLIYSSNGRVVNPAIPAWQGVYPNAYASLSAFFDDSSNEADFLQYDSLKSPQTSILRYDLKNFSFIGSSPVNGALPQGWDLIRYGANNIAFATAKGIIFSTVSTTPPPTINLAHLSARHLINDDFRGRIYASVPGSVPGIGNSIAVIDPTSAAIVNTIPVGSEPDVMALSADKAYLYVGLDGSGSVARVNLATSTVDLSVHLGFDSFFGPEVAASLSVSPTDSTVVAVARVLASTAPPQAGVAIYKNGVMLANATQRFMGSSTISFCSSGTNLYGFDGYTTEYGFYTMSVDATGVKQTGEVQGLISGRANIQCDKNVIYATSGYAVDPVSNSQLGAFSGMQNPVALAVDDANKKIFFLDTDSTAKGITIVGFDQTNYNRTGSLPVTSSTGTAQDLVRWGTNGFAVATQNQVVILTGTLP